MKVIVVAVGTPKQPGVVEAIQEYESRLRHYFKFDTVEIRPERIPASREDAAISRRESQALLDNVPSGLEATALDRRGERWSSEDLAGYLSELATYGKPGVAFLIGGPLGLSEVLRTKVKRVFSLGSLTLAHEIARLVLAEQLYRAGTIQRGEPYHRGG